MQRGFKLVALGAVFTLVTILGLSVLQSGSPIVSAAGASIRNQTPPPPPPPPPTGGGTGTVTFQGSWNLVGCPTGTVLTGATGNIFTFQAGNTAYQSFPVTTALTAPQGYWAFFTAPTTVTLATPPTATSQTVALPVNQFIMVGNPFGVPVSLSGASQVFVYNTTTGQYQTATTLQPCQGAWVISPSGGTLTISTTLTPPTPPSATATPTPTTNPVVLPIGQLLLQNAALTGCSFANGELFLQPGMVCQVGFQPSQGIGTYTVVGSAGLRLGCLNLDSFCTSLGGGQSVTLLAASANQTLTFTISPGGAFFQGDQASSW